MLFNNPAITLEDIKFDKIPNHNGLIVKFSLTFIFTFLQNMCQNTVTSKICQNKKLGGWAKWMHIYPLPGIKNQFNAKAFLFL